MLGVSVATAGTLLTRVRKSAFGQTLDYSDKSLTKRDIAILKFLSTIELIESDLWQQYEELGGTREGTQNSYQLALQDIDENCSEYISSNCIDEIGHATFLCSYLESEGVAPVTLDKYRTLQGSRATDANDIGRLTSLMYLDFDQIRYMQSGAPENTEFGDPVPQMADIVNRSAIPRTDEDFYKPAVIRAIANAAVSHFGFIERGVSSLYTSLSRQVRRAKVLKIVLGIGAQETAHFLRCAEFASPSVDGRPTKGDNSESSFKDRRPRLSDFNASLGRPRLPTSAFFSDFSEFILNSMQHSPLIRPLDDRFDGTVATIRSLTEAGLFVGQSNEFLQELMTLAEEADTALRR
jgi:hypothetical protein